MCESNDPDECQMWAVAEQDFNGNKPVSLDGWVVSNAYSQ